METLNTSVLITSRDSRSLVIIKKAIQESRFYKEAVELNTKAECVIFLNEHFSGSIVIPDIIWINLNLPANESIPFFEAVQRLNISTEKQISIILTLSGHVSQEMRISNVDIKYRIEEPLTLADMYELLGEGLLEY